MKILLTSTRGPQTSQSSFNENQLSVLRTRVLPILEPIVDATHLNWIQEKQQVKFVPNPHKNIIHQCWSTFALVRDVLKVATTQNTPALRISRWKKALNGQTKVKATLDKLLMTLLAVLIRYWLLKT